MRNFNSLRLPLLTGVVALALGATACTGGESSPAPITPTQPHKTIEGPTCTKIAALPTDKAHTMDISFIMTNADQSGEWKVGGANYSFGDGSTGNTQQDEIGMTHTFPHAGHYPVSVDVLMDVAPGVPPVGRIDTVGCPITTINVP